ncbi:TspO/MBR family protein [Cyanobium sp. HWJ4-Hawea]|uniref:TspO/MBR family protein n=1 Tax=Cyanobium sp. HWJ4-Hawea TaxID=2823713 RepID=UPI0028F40BCA|nr:tryptophan-rich sensory protein [Cyanobium sp. HWJ4-Hawea]
MRRMPGNDRRQARLVRPHTGSMVAALLILLVMVAVGALLNPSREQFAWFIRLRRPAWLTFEGLIPLIWISIYVCFYSSALLTWNGSWSWGLMAGYLGLLLLVQSYTWLICTTRKLGNGTAVGLAGWVWGVALAMVVLPHSIPAVLLLIPYLLWSPLGTLVTWQMQRLNR